MKVIYHITTPAAWADAQAAGEVRAESLATEGFIHCSRRAQLLAVANRFFPGEGDLLVLAIDENAVAQWLVNEGPDGEGDPFSEQSFPHIYGPIPLAAVVATAPLSAGSDSSFEWPV
jgi:uncharacterized protein (DUF952 family)